MSTTLVNRVAKSGIQTINLEAFAPELEVSFFDIKDFLFQELILREKEFRAALAEHDWSQYEDNILVVHCSVDAIIPSWANMLISTYAVHHTKQVIFARPDTWQTIFFKQKIEQEDWSTYQDQLVVIKGCGDTEVPSTAYADLTMALMPYAKSIMFGEPCSTVPVFKRPKHK